MKDSNDPLRGTGRTTRKVDEYIQELFKNRFCDLSKEEEYEIMEIIPMMKRRLKSEHTVNLDNHLIINRDRTTVELSKDYKFRSDYDRFK